jgi:hypothetical protein
MHHFLHLVSYLTPVALLVAGPASALIPMKIKKIPIVFSALFSVLIAHFEPAPNNDDFFTLY